MKVNILKVNMLGNLCKLAGGAIQTGPFGSQLHQSDYREHGVAVVMPQDIVNDQISEERIVRIDEFLAQKLNRHLLEEGDIVFPRRGDISKRAYVSANQVGMFCGTGCLRIRVGNTELHPRWFFYFLAQEHVIKWIEGKAIGATMLNLNTSILGSLPVEYPSYAEQAQIAQFLDAYDDLIAANQRHIQLLEESARLLYREWFIKLRFPNHEQTKIVDGIPEGWKQQTFDDVCEAIGGGTPSTKYSEYWNGDVTWVTPTDITRNDCLYLIDSQKKITESGLHSSSSKLLPKEAILMTSRASIGFFAIADRVVCTNQGFISIIPKISGSRMFLLFHLMERVDEIIGLSTGSTFKELSKKTFKAMSIIFPEHLIVKAFCEQVEVFFQQVKTLKLQNDRLRQARDALLPKLMSGEFRC